jgi:hypothetical protein
MLSKCRGNFNISLRKIYMSSMSNKFTVILLALFFILMIFNTSAQGYYDPYGQMVKNELEKASDLSNSITNTKMEQNKNNQVIVQSMIGDWKMPGGVSVAITADDIDLMAAAENNSGRTQIAKLSSSYGIDYSAWKGNVDPLDVFVYALIKLHHDNNQLVPLPVVESGLNGVLLKLVYYNNNALNRTERFWMKYTQIDFDPSYFQDPDGVRRDFVMYLDFRDNEALQKIIPMTHAWLDYESFNNNIMQDWGESLRLETEWEELSYTKRQAYLTQWAAEWSISKAEYELSKS